MFIRSKNEDDTGHCLGRPAKRGHCLECGACTEPKQKQNILTHTSASNIDQKQMEIFQELMAKKRRLTPIYARFRLSPLFRGVNPSWANAFVFQKLLSIMPKEVDNLLAVEEQLFSIGDNWTRFGIIGGETVLALKSWDNDRLATALSRLGAGVCDEVSFLSFVESFTPGVFRQVHVDLDMCVAAPADAGSRLSAFLRDSHLPVSILRADDCYRLEIKGKGPKRDILICGTYSVVGDHFLAHLDIGPKFDLQAFMRGMHGDFCHPDDQVELSGLVL